MSHLYKTILTYLFSFEVAYYYFTPKPENSKTRDTMIYKNDGGSVAADTNERLSYGNKLSRVTVNTFSNTYLIRQKQIN